MSVFEWIGARFAVYSGGVPVEACVLKQLAVPPSAKKQLKQGASTNLPGPHPDNIVKYISI